MGLCRWNRAVGIVRSVGDYSSMCCGRELSANRLMSAVSSYESPSPPPLISLIVDDNKLRSLGADGSVFEVNIGGDGEVVGLSHGWLTLFNKRNNNSLFLSDPLSRRLINLPPYHTLPDPCFNTDLDGYGAVSKVVLSSSPDDDDCRAMMIFGPAKRLAFCLPGRSSEWTPIGDPFLDGQDDYFRYVRFARVHDDLVYCTRRRVFTSVSPCHFDYSTFWLGDTRVISLTDFTTFIAEICDWDIREADCRRSYPKELIALHGNKLEGGATHEWLEENEDFLKYGCVHIPHIVYAEHSNQQFLVLRYVRLIDGGDDRCIPYCPEKGLEEVFECQTYGFVVLEIDVGGQFEVVEDLNGMAMFVGGVNSSFAIPAETAAANELKANSIYFTDAKRSRMMCGVNDNGIFDYQNKTISPFPLHQPLA